MSNRTLTFLSLAVVACLGILLAINLIPLIQGVTPGKYFQNNDIRGIAVQHKGLLYTLNFDQQNKLVDWINHTAPVSQQSFQKTSDLNIDKIHIYLFGKPDVELFPITYVNDNLIFSAPALNASALLKDTSNGLLKKMLSETYDP
jgi:hypothetical protein